MPERLNLRGERFGSLVVLHPVAARAYDCGTRRSQWACRCDCGSLVERTTAQLMQSRKAGQSPCCGECRALWARARSVQQQLQQMWHEHRELYSPLFDEQESERIIDDLEPLIGRPTGAVSRSQLNRWIGEAVA